MSNRREELLDAAIDYVADEGFPDFSLRPLAEAIGTSHRMLLHHFGSKAGLEQAIVERTTELMTIPLAAEGTANSTPRELVETTWAALSDLNIEPLIKLYFDISRSATHGDEASRDVVLKVREHWTNAALAADPDGDPEQVIRGAAVTSTFLKGLLFDQLSGGSLVNSADILEQFISLIEGNDIARRPANAVDIHDEQP